LVNSFNTIINKVQMCQNTNKMNEIAKENADKNITYYIPQA